MAQITLTIPDAVVPKLLTAYEATDAKDALTKIKQDFVYVLRTRLVEYQARLSIQQAQADIDAVPFE